MKRKGTREIGSLYQGSVPYILKARAGEYHLLYGGLCYIEFIKLRFPCNETILFSCRVGGSGGWPGSSTLTFSNNLGGGGGGAVILHHNFSHSLSVPFQFMPNFVTC